MARLTETETRYLLHIDKSQKERAKAIQGRVWLNSQKAWGYPKTPESYSAILAEFGHELQDETVQQSHPALAPSSFPEPMSAGVVTAGSGPYEEGHFDELLERHGIEIHPLGTRGIALLVLGRDEWNETQVSAHVEARRENELRLYSQEMFLAYLATQQDPYDYEDSDILEAFGEGHPAFEFLGEWGFSWPQTTIVPGLGLPNADHGDPSSWPQIGLLGHLGYSVGANGVNVLKRRLILQRVFLESVPNVTSMAYMNEWGMPKSSLRLQKLANSLASFARNAQRRPSPPTQAINDWESDLQWLKNAFYQSRFSFRWPTT